MPRMIAQISWRCGLRLCNPLLRRTMAAPWSIAPAYLLGSMREAMGVGLPVPEQAFVEVIKRQALASVRDGSCVAAASCLDHKTDSSHGMYLIRNSPKQIEPAQVQHFLGGRWEGVRFVGLLLLYALCCSFVCSFSCHNACLSQKEPQGIKLSKPE